MNSDVDFSTVPGECLVNRIVYDFIHEMVQADGTGGPDVHRRALANGLQPLENLNLLGVVHICRTVVSWWDDSGGGVGGQPIRRRSIGGWPVRRGEVGFEFCHEC